MSDLSWALWANWSKLHLKRTHAPEWREREMSRREIQNCGIEFDSFFWWNEKSRWADQCGVRPLGSSTSTNPGEFASSSLEVLTGAPPRGARVVRLPGSPAVPIWRFCLVRSLGWGLTDTALNFSYGATAVGLGTLRFESCCFRSMDLTIAAYHWSEAPLQLT